MIVSEASMHHGRDSRILAGGKLDEMSRLEVSFPPTRAISDEKATKWLSTGRRGNHGFRILVDFLLGGNAGIPAVIVTGSTIQGGPFLASPDHSAADQHSVRCFHGCFDHKHQCSACLIEVWVLCQLNANRIGSKYNTVQRALY